MIEPLGSAALSGICWRVLISHENDNGSPIRPSDLVAVQNGHKSSAGRSYHDLTTCFVPSIQPESVHQALEDLLSDVPILEQVDLAELSRGRQKSYMQR